MKQALERLVDGVTSRRIQQLGAVTSIGATTTMEEKSGGDQAVTQLANGKLADGSLTDGNLAVTQLTDKTLTDGDQAVTQLLQKVLLQRCKAMLGESNLAVRQVCA